MYVMYISFAADRWTQYCDQRISVSVYLFVCLFICLFVCLFVCPLAKAISKTTRPNVNKFLYGPTCYLWPWRNAPLTAMRYVMYFRFVDDVIFYKLSEWAESETTRMFRIEFVTWRHQSDVKQRYDGMFGRDRQVWQHRGRSLPSATLSCCLCKQVFSDYRLCDHLAFG